MDFEYLVEKITLKLKAITRKLDGKYTLFDHGDLYQEAMLHLWQEHKTGGLSDKTDSFILQGCYFFLKNYIRKVYKGVERNSVSMDSKSSAEGNTFENILSLEAVRPSQADSVDLGLLIEEIRKVLTKRERDIFSLYLENLTTREIGKKIGVSHVMVVKIEKQIKDKCKALKDTL